MTTNFRSRLLARLAATAQLLDLQELSSLRDGAYAGRAMSGAVHESRWSVHEPVPVRRWRSRQAWVASLLFALALLAFVQQLQLAKLEPGFPPATARYPLRLDGIELGTREELRFLVETLPVDRVLELRDAAGMSYHSALRPRFNALQSAVTLLSGSAFFLIAILIFGPRADDPRVRDFHRAGLAYGAALLTGGIYYPRGDWLLALVGITHLAALMAAPIYFLRVSLAFPRPHPWQARRWLVRTAALLCGLVLAWQLFSYAMYFVESTPERASAIVPAKHAADFVLVLIVALGCGILFHSSRHLELTREREEARWILWGIAIGVTPYVFLRSLPELLGLPALLPAELDRLAELAIPASFVVALFRYRLVDIDRLIRESLVVAILTGSVLLVYALLSRLTLRDPSGQAFSRLGLLPLALGLLAGIGMQPLREWLGRWIDRTLFTDQYDQAQDLDRLAQVLRQQRTVEALCVHMLRFVERRLAPEPISVMLEDRGELRIAGLFAPQQARQVYEQLRRRPADGPALLAAPNATTLPEFEQSEAPTSHAIEVVQLIRRGEQWVGALLLGGRAGGRRYAKADLELLGGLAQLAGRVHERMQLNLAMIEESMRAAQLDEIDRFRREFLSRVAHDLRTPLASISWSTDNLLDGLAGELSAQQRSYLESMRIAARHLQRMLNNLLELSRLENPQDRPAVQPTALLPLCENACQVLAPLAAQRGVRLTLQALDSSVAADPDRLLEALLNLLDNAIRYSADHATVELTVTRGAGESVLCVRDHGPGLDPELLDSIFEPYRQGQRSPHSQRHGFGLGLHVTRALLERMGARVEARNADGGGAEFRIVFPDPAEETA